MVSGRGTFTPRKFLHVSDEVPQLGEILTLDRFDREQGGLRYVQWLNLILLQAFYSYGSTCMDGVDDYTFHMLSRAPNSSRVCIKC